MVCKLGWIECAVCASLLCASIPSLITVPYGAPSPHTLCLALGPPKNPRPLFFLAFPAPQAPFFWPPSLFSGARAFFWRRSAPCAFFSPPLPPPCLLPATQNWLKHHHHHHYQYHWAKAGLRPARPSGLLTSRSARKWEVMIFRDTQTLHHNIYIVVTMTSSSSSLSSLRHHHDHISLRACFVE